MNLNLSSIITLYYHTTTTNPTIQPTNTRYPSHNPPPLPPLTLSPPACKVTIKVPPLFAKYVSVNPQMLFVQANTSQAVNLKFEPIPNITKKLAYFSVPFEEFDNAALVQIPIEVQMANQELPVFFILRSIVCQVGVGGLDCGFV